MGLDHQKSLAFENQVTRGSAFRRIAADLLCAVYVIDGERRRTAATAKIKLRARRG